MKILGIDPGLNYTGWGMIEASTSSVNFIDCGIINPSNKQSSSKRLFKIYSELNSVILGYSPEVVALEEIFINKNPSGTLKLGYARGVALMVPSIYNLEVFEYPATTVKKTVSGNGHASKEQIKSMMKLIMPNIKDLKDDAIDAISIAVCHAYHKKI